MPYNITGRIPPAVWWLVGIGVLLISAALAVNILASDNVSVGVDGIEIKTEEQPVIPEQPTVPSYDEIRIKQQDQQQQQKGY